MYANRSGSETGFNNTGATMIFPATVTEVAQIDWASPEARCLTIADFYVWEAAAAARRVVEPVPDEQAWDETEMDVRRTVP
jgi:hypothetical protein